MLKSLVSFPSVYIWTNLDAFHILLPNFFAAIVHSSSKGTSWPGEAFSTKENLRASAPCLSDSSNGSIVFPRLLDIFLPFESLTRPWTSMSLNGMSFWKLMPIIIIRATQKNMMSNPTTNNDVG